MHSPHPRGHTAKHTAAHKHGATHKHHPQHHRHPRHHHLTKQNAAAKAAHAHKPRQLSYNINCSLEALADSAPFPVTDADILWLYKLTPKTSEGVQIRDVLATVQEFGFAGHYLEYEELDYAVPGCITGFTLPEGTHAAYYDQEGINMWGEIYPVTDFIIEEAWRVSWL